MDRSPQSGSESGSIQLVSSPAERLQWYAVHTRSRHEKKAEAYFREKDIQSFLPLITQIRRWSDRRKEVQFPLFPCYTFVRIISSVETRLSVVKAPGVLGIVGSHGMGTPIPDKEIQDIQTLFAQGVSCSIHPFLKIGQRVRVRGGALDGIEGILVARKSNRSLVLSVELIQQSMAINISGYDLDPI